MHFKVINAYIFCYILQTQDLPLVHRCIAFSSHFTLQEMKDRWNALLYDRTISSVSKTAMRQLHPNFVTNIKNKVLFSTAEEELLATIKSV